MRTRPGVPQSLLCGSFTSVSVQVQTVSSYLEALTSELSLQHTWLFPVIADHSAPPGSTSSIRGPSIRGLHQRGPDTLLLSHHVPLKVNL